MGQGPLVAVNILPQSIEQMREALDRAVHLGFKQAWFNPLNQFTSKTLVHRFDLDTGVMSDLFGSLYCITDLRELRFDLSMLKALNETYQEKGIKLYADFVWKHVSKDSLLCREHPDWFKRRPLKDVIEFDLDNIKRDDARYDAILDYLKAGVDVLLNDCGFTGLRLDAASHFPVHVRDDLMAYIKTTYPNAEILEEVLMDGKQAMRVKALGESAVRKNLKSTYVTSNLAYQVPDEYGQVPQPHEMGDSHKLKMADLPISFTGNHDHFSLPWSVIMALAAKFVVDQPDGVERAMAAVCRSVLPVVVKGRPGFEAYAKAIEQLAADKLTINSLSLKQEGVLAVLLSFAHEIAFDLCRSTNKSSYYPLFSELMHSTLYRRTIASPGGYFVLDSDVNLQFDTQRIFSNAHGQPLGVLAITPAHILRMPKASLENLLVAMCQEKYPHSDKLILPNMMNFLKGFGKKIAVKKEKSGVGVSLAITKSLSEEDIRLLFPYIMMFLRAIPAERCQELVGKSEGFQTDKLASEMNWPAVISSVNQIAVKLQTVDAALTYDTFTSLEHYTITVRASKNKTDIIVQGPHCEPAAAYEFTRLDLEKIAAWYQARKFPMPGRAGTAAPMSDEPLEFSDGGTYAHHWCVEKGQKDAFDFSYQRIIGKEGHETRLYLGEGLTCHAAKFGHVDVALVTTPIDEAQEAFLTAIPGLSIFSSPAAEEVSEDAIEKTCVEVINTWMKL